MAILHLSPPLKAASCDNWDPYVIVTYATHLRCTHSHRSHTSLESVESGDNVANKISFVSVRDLTPLLRLYHGVYTIRPPWIPERSRHVWVSHRRNGKAKVQSAFYRRVMHCSTVDTRGAAQLIFTYPYLIAGGTQTVLCRRIGK